MNLFLVVSHRSIVVFIEGETVQPIIEVDYVVAQYLVFRTTAITLSLSAATDTTILVYMIFVEGKSFGDKLFNDSL